MKVFMKKDVVQVGKAGTILVVPDGYGRNYLLPHGFAVEITPENEASFKKILQNKILQKDTLITKTSLLADKLKALKLMLKKKMHDDGKLYGAVNAHELVELLANQEISITKSQVIFEKAIKSKGNYIVTIKLTSQLQVPINLTVIPE